jgi:ATP-dependent DNA ligase
MLEFHPADVCRLRAARVFLNAFDMIELEGEYIRRDPLAVRKATLASLLSRAAPESALQRAHG